MCPSKVFQKSFENKKKIYKKPKNHNLLVYLPLESQIFSTII